MSDSKTVMIVDDSKVSRMIITQMIKDKALDLTIIEAEDGQQAIELSNNKGIDFFSIDYNMPGLDGLQLIAELKLTQPDSKYALLTANIQEATHKKAQQAGAICINKPISEASVSAMLEYFYG